MSSLDLFGFLHKSITLPCSNVDLRLLGIDSGSPRLKFLLLDFNLIMENLRLICIVHVSTKRRAVVKWRGCLPLRLS